MMTSKWQTKFEAWKQEFNICAQQMGFDSELRKESDTSENWKNIRNQLLDQRYYLHPEFSRVSYLLSRLEQGSYLGIYGAIATYPAEEIFAILNHSTARYDAFHPYQVRVNSRRLKLFQKQQFCAACGIQGTFFKLYHQKNDRENKAHLAFYALGSQDSSGNHRHILMTVDHIIPLSCNGPNSWENIQTMCADCNVKKGNKMPVSNNNSESFDEPTFNKTI